MNTKELRVVEFDVYNSMSTTEKRNYCEELNKHYRQVLEEIYDEFDNYLYPMVSAWLQHGLSRMKRYLMGNTMNYESLYLIYSIVEAATTALNKLVANSAISERINMLQLCIMHNGSYECHSSYYSIADDVITDNYLCSCNFFDYKEVTKLLSGFMPNVNPEKVRRLLEVYGSILISDKDLDKFNNPEFDFPENLHYIPTRLYDNNNI